ncbi:cell division protein FtsQ [Aeromicrobium panaciterrae]|uniref:cell division protein FtsQ/DivIB n=1 Tax=Aeromicrobium panaciterrae TaxID=363861 RepID=UPI0031D0ABB1
MSDPRFAARRRDGLIQRWRRPLILVGSVLLIGMIVWGVWFSGLLAVSKVVVQGETTLTEAQIRDAADVPIGRPLARVDTVAIEARVASMERVQAVSVSRSLPHTIKITIAERIPVAYARLGGQIRGIDQYGIAYRTFDSPPKGLLEASVIVSDPRRRQQTLAAVASVVKAIKDAPFRKDVQLVTASTKDSIVLNLTKGREITWGSAGSAQRKIAVLGSLLQISAKQYDVSAPDQPTTRK